jgi:hypothetical protein
MVHKVDSLSALVERANALHTLIVGHLIAYAALGMILAITLSRAVEQVEHIQFAKLKQDLQGQVNLSGKRVSEDNLCAWWDSIDVLPDPSKLSPDAAVRKTAEQKSQDLINSTRAQCAATHPYTVEFKYFDFPFSFNLQYWAFAVPFLFLIAAGFLYRLWRERTLIYVAGREIYSGLDAGEDIPLSSALLFGSTPMGPSMSAQTVKITEGLLGAAFLGVVGYVLSLLASIWSQLGPDALIPLLKIYCLACLFMLCFVADCSRRIRMEIETWFGSELPRGWSFPWSAIRHPFQTVRASLHRFVPLRASALVASALATSSLFLACGIQGCAGTKVNGIELLKFNTGAFWYLNDLMDPTWKIIGRGTYALGILVAAVALLAVALSFISKIRTETIFTNAAYRCLVLFSAFVVIYELAWGDFLLTVWPFYLFALVLSLLLALNTTRARLAGWVRSSIGGNTKIYGRAFWVYSAFLSLTGIVYLIQQRFWGVLVFATSQLLLLRSVSEARRIKVQKGQASKISGESTGMCVTEDRPA